MDFKKSDMKNYAYVGANSDLGCQGPGWVKKKKFHPIVDPSGLKNGSIFRDCEVIFLKNCETKTDN